jgi:Type I phosphodiesterase / nucleotide pyrophosphatase
MGIQEMAAFSHRSEAGIMKAVFYFVDGFGWRYLADRGTLGDRDWRQARPLETVLGYSSSIVPVLISGRSPAETGVWTEYYREDRDPTFVGSMARAVKGSATPLNMARLVAFRFARKAGLQSAHRLRIPLELSHHFRRHDINYKAMPPCSLPYPTIAEVCKEQKLGMSFQFIAGQQDAADAVDRVQAELDKTDVFFMYDCTVDHAGHTYGPDSGAMDGYVERVGQTLDAIGDVVGRKYPLETLVFSDHGMTRVDRAFDIFGALEPLRIGRDFLAFPDSTFARFWYPDERSREKVREALQGVPGSFLTKDEAIRYGVPYPDERYGHDIVVADEGVVFHPSYISPSFFRTAFPDKGMHGYRPEVPSADGIVLYRGEVIGDDLPSRVPAAGVFGAMTSIAEAMAS